MLLGTKQGIPASRFFQSAECLESRVSPYNDVELVVALAPYAGTVGQFGTNALSD
jgi:hypothetical protein